MANGPPQVGTWDHPIWSRPRFGGDSATFRAPTSSVITRRLLKVDINAAVAAWKDRMNDETPLAPKDRSRKEAIDGLVKACEATVKALRGSKPHRGWSDLLRQINEALLKAKETA